MEQVESAYEQARESGILPGYAIIAGDKNGKSLYSHANGTQSLSPTSSHPFQLTTICAIASMTKLLTIIAVLQCVENNLLDLDAPVTHILPEVGKFGIITDFNEETKEAEFEQPGAEITLRMLVTHTSGYTYDWFHPTLLAWRASRNEIPWAGEGVEQKATIPLVFEPGTQFAYGVGMDWAGKAVERVTNCTLEEYMQAHIWDPLNITDITFHPHQREDMQGRIADLSTLGPDGKGPAVLDTQMDMLGGATQPFGGGGAFASTEAFFTFLHAVLQCNALLLSPSSFEELFRPQLSPPLKASLHEYLYSDPLKAQYLAMGLDQGIRKTWCLAGLLCEDGQEGRFSPGTVFWGGVPSMMWWIDNEKGTCGVAGCQVVPPMSPSIMQLHEGFQKGVFSSFA